MFFIRLLPVFDSVPIFFTIIEDLTIQLRVEDVGDVGDIVREVLLGMICNCKFCKLLLYLHAFYTVVT